MNLIFFSHPGFLKSQSMSRFAQLLAEGMSERGHDLEILSPKSFFYQLPVTHAFKKWLGYLDQFFLFPLKVRLHLRNCPPDTLFIFTDHALGPWVPLIIKRPHVIHCHDFLAQRSALGLISENRTGRTGRLYQTYIHRGYSQAKHFISVSNKTKEDLHRFLSTTPETSEVVYNGINKSFKRLNTNDARIELGKKLKIDLSGGYLLHVGGNQWYKNRKGVVKLYDSWRKMATSNLPLLLIGEQPDKKLLHAIKESAFLPDIHVLTGIVDEWIRIAYAGATVFLFPSLAEGFGWPIAEAMASGCPVITTKERPMTEVGGDAAFYIEKFPANQSDGLRWGLQGAELIDKITRLSIEEREKVIESGIENCLKFDATNALDKIEKIYRRILTKHSLENTYGKKGRKFHSVKKNSFLHAP